MEFRSNPIQEHEEVPLADDGRWEELIARFARRSPNSTLSDAANHSFVVSVGAADTAPTRAAQLAEILALVRAQGDRVAGHALVQVARPDPRTFIGRGVYESIVARAEACGADMLVLDADLSPSQTRNIEDATGLSVCDREAVILNVFLRHAKTRKARVQVEIAQLEYLRPRIRGLGLVMDQQAGGVMRGRGPGETASELMARRLDGRLGELRRTFGRLQKTEAVQRKARRDCERVVLVGYTNAGKTTLMNALTEERLSARDRPFETLDTTSRCLTRHGTNVLLSDTVGFIRRLPERLLASFESTLSEIQEASLLAVVVDASDPEWELHLRTTEGLLERLEASEVPRFYVFTKIDRLTTGVSEATLCALRGEHPQMSLSSHDPMAVGRLKDALIRHARRTQRVRRIFVPYTATKATALVYGRCRVLESEAKERGIRFTLEAQPHLLTQVAVAAQEDRS